MKVTDPGEHGAPPDQHSPHVLEGNVSRQGQSQDQFNLGPPQAALLAVPETRIVQPKVFKAWLDNTHPDLGQVSKDAVIEVKGQWDDSGHAMHSFGIPFTKVPASKLAEMNLANAWILVVDCAGNVPGPGLEKVREFVKNGGFLITTDWSLDGCLTRAIPGFINWNGGYSTSSLVDATVVSDDADLLAGAVGQAFWKLDTKCQTVHILNPRRVQILVRSRQLMRDDPDGRGILALTFDYGRGKVLHLVGHFDNNSDRAFNNALPDPAPGIGISLRQAIAANFVALAIKTHRQEQAANQPEGAAQDATAAGK